MLYFLMSSEEYVFLMFYRTTYDTFPKKSLKFGFDESV